MAAPRIPILFISQSRLGDAVLSSGLIKALADRTEGASFTIVASALTAPLFAQVPGLERILILEKRALGLHWLGLLRDVGFRRWSLIVDLRGAAATALINHRRRAAHRKPPIPLHKVVEAGRLIAGAQEPPAPYIFTNAAIEARAESLTAGEGPILAMAPNTNWVGKTWPAERFAKVARDLLGPDGPLAGGRLMVLGGPGDRRDAVPVLSAVPRERVIDLVGREDLLVLHAALKRARLFIGGDSGLMHMAAAAGAPTLGLFGPSDERLYAPWGPAARVVRGPRGFAVFKAIDPGLNQALCHMMDLKVDTVREAAAQLLADTADLQGPRDEEPAEDIAAEAEVGG
jgi:ADP-heptose:LPS heptosyltransferase